MPEIQQTSPHPLEQALRAVGGIGAERELSVIDAVLLACELSEDGTEVNDVIDGLVDQRAACLLPVARDPMFERRPAPVARAGTVTRLTT